MPKSDDITALYDQFSGNANSFHEIGRAARAVEASSRWPLFSHMAQERGALVPSAGDQTPDAATQRHQDESVLQLTPADSEPPLPPAWLQRTSEAVAPDLRNTATHAPSVWNMGRRPATAPTTAPSTASLALPFATSSAATEPTMVKREPVWQRAPAVHPAATTPPPKPASPPELLSAAASQTQPRSPAPAFPLVSEASPPTGASPLRRLVRADPPTPSIGVSNDAPLAEDLMSVFSRLAGRSSGERER